jgi:hypothetical protein
MDDFNEAIKHILQAKSLMPEGHTSKTLPLLNIGNLYFVRFKSSRDAMCLEKASEAFREAAMSPAGSPFKLVAARWWGRLSRSQNINSTLEAYKMAMSLLPQVVWLGATDAPG